MNAPRKVARRVYQPAGLRTQKARPSGSREYALYISLVMVVMVVSGIMIIVAEIARIW